MSHPNTSYDIGGRATDIAQISMSLELRLKAIYLANEVPKELIHEVCVLEAGLEILEECIEACIIRVA